jgi:hypothetical protein
MESFDETSKVALSAGTPYFHWFWSSPDIGLMGSIDVQQKVAFLVGCPYFYWPRSFGAFRRRATKKPISTARFGTTFFRRTYHFGKVRMGSGSSNYIRAITLLSSKQHPGYLYSKTGNMRKSAQ